MNADQHMACALEEIASSAVRRGHTDVYRFAMSALGFLLLDPDRHRATADAVLDACRTYLTSRRSRA